MAEYVRHLLKLHKTHEKCCVLNSRSKCNAYAGFLAFIFERTLAELILRNEENEKIKSFTNWLNWVVRIY